METTQPPESAQVPTPVAPAPPAPPEPPAPLTPPAPAAPAASGPPANFGQLLKRAFHIWKVQWLKMAALNVVPGLAALAGFGVAYGAIKLLPAAASVPVFVLVLVAVLPVMAWLSARVGAAQIRLALGADAGMSLGEAWSTSKGMAWSLILVGALSALVVAGGYLFLVVPGVIWALSFVFAPYVLVRDGVRGRDALVRSRQLVKGDWWWLLVRLFIFMLLMVLISAPMSVLGIIFRQNQVAASVFNLLGSLVGMFIITPLAFGFSTAAFESLSARKSASLVPMPKAKKVYTIAAVFGILLPIIMVAALWSMLSLMLRFIAPSRSANDIDLMKLRVDAEALEIQAEDTTAPAEEPSQPKMPARDDLDNDGLYDPQERTSGDTDPTNPDTDGDGLGDGDEYLLSTWADLPDSDGDGFNDGDEIVNGFDPTAAGQPLPEETRALLIDRYQKGELHEPTITTLRPILE